jgi:hypothetical protein
MKSPASFSSSLKSESRWSGVPSTTGVSQVPHTPSRHDDSALTPASCTTSRIERSAGTVTVMPERWQTTSKVVASAPSSTGFAAKRSTCRLPGGHVAHCRSTACSSASGPHA